MKLALLAASMMMTMAAHASGNHAGGHEETKAIGTQGKKSDVDRTVSIAMTEKDDGSMAFEPAIMSVKAGETLRLALINKGQTDHEFVMATLDEIMEHKTAMEKFPEMEHAEPNMVGLAPGEKGEIVWTFTNADDFTFACLIPGHYDLGMKGRISVSQN